MQHRIIFGNKVHIIDDMNCTGDAKTVEFDGMEFYIFDNRDDAEKVASDYWRNLAEHDPEEFRCMVGDENIVKWALGEMAGPGCVQVSSLEEWFELCGDYCEEHLAYYDGEEREALVPQQTADEFGFKTKDVLLYRIN